jgi:serine/threonine protein kinase
VSAPRVPERIGPCLIHGVIGRGGMGVVYDAERDGARVALKTVVGAKARTVAAVRREIRALRRLHHDGIVPVIADGVDGGMPWYAMPFVEGLSLRANRHEEALLALHALAPPPGAETMHTEAPTVTHAGSMLSHDMGLTRAEALLPAMPGASASSPSGASGTGGRVGVRVGEVLDPAALPRVLRVVRRLAGALAYLHGEGLVHRDLKPDNVIVRPGDRPVLVDFGLVSSSTGQLSRDVVDDLASLGAGTAAYMAPEQVLGEPLDARVDLYALGCILYELIRGRPPFVGDTVASLLHQHVRVEPPPLSTWVPWVPPALDALVLSLLQKRRADRCGHASDVVARLSGIGRELGDDSVDPPGPSPRPVVYRPGLVGRDAALATLTARVERLRSDGGVVLLPGPSGVGKTRLAVEAARQAGAAGAVVVEGAAHAHLTPPLGPLRGVLHTIAESCTRGGAERTRALLGPRARALAAFLPDLVVVPGFEAVARDAVDEPVSPSQARERLVHALHETLTLLARERPLLLVLDDVQWADEATLAVLEHLAQQPRLEGLLVLCTVRSGEGDRVVARLAGPGSSVVGVAPIADADVEAMIADATGGHRLAAGDVAAIVARAGGLPFLVSEAVHAIVVDGVAASALPTDPLVLVGRRLHGLPPSTRAVVDAVAVAGPSATARVVATLVDRPLADVQDDIDALRRSWLFVDDGALDGVAALESAVQNVENAADVGAFDDGDVVVAFAHDRLAEAARVALDATTRATLHRRVAGILEGLAADVRAARAAELAFHHERARPPSRGGWWPPSRPAASRCSMRPCVCSSGPSPCRSRSATSPASPAPG